MGNSSAPRNGANEGDEGWCKGYEQGGSGRGSRGRLRAEEEGLQQGHREAWRDSRRPGERRWQVCLAGGVHGQDSLEARDQGGQEGGVRQGGYGEGEAGQDRGEGLPCVRIEEAVLRLDSVGFATNDLGPFVPWAPTGRIDEAPGTVQRGDATRSRWQYTVGTCTHFLEKK